MLKRYCILLSLASILVIHAPVLSSANGKDEVFLQGPLLCSLELFEVYCPYELLACGDYLYLFDSDRSCYKLDKLKNAQSQYADLYADCAYQCFALYGPNSFIVADDGEDVYRLINKEGEVVSFDKLLK